MGEWVTQWRVEFLGREWNVVDIGSVVVVLALHCLALLAPFHFTWPAFWVAVALYLVVVVSVNLSYHRQLFHRSFKLPKWLEYFFAYCGVLSFQRSPLEWVSIHRSHHQFTDTLKVPHSPVRGFWYIWSHCCIKLCVCSSYHIIRNVIAEINAYMTMFLNFEILLYEARLKNVGDLKRQPFYRFLHYTYPLHAIGFGGARSVIFLHATFGINSICHTWGQQVWDTGDLVEFLGREWNVVDIGSVVVVLALHCLALFAPFHFTWPAFWVAVALYLVVGVSVNLSYHRQLSHRSFKLPKWLKYFFAYCGVLSFQPFCRFLHYTYPLHAIGFGVFLYALGGFPFLVWGLGVRSVIFLHATFGINSICHTWGQQKVGTNNHHAFEHSARHGLEWWQIDITWYVIRFLEVVGLATDVKLPTETQKNRRAVIHVLLNFVLCCPFEVMK
ncbi:unnamed protein product [Malus baccata var. baccata]